MDWTFDDGAVLRAMDVWLIPALAATLGSWIVSSAWRRIRGASAGTSTPALMSFIMGAVCAWYRGTVLGRSLENNTLVLLAVAGLTTLTWHWLQLRRKGGPPPR